MPLLHRALVTIINNRVFFQQTTEKKFKEAKKFIKELSQENNQLLTELKKRFTLFSFSVMIT